MLKRVIYSWLSELFEKIKEDPLRNLLLIFLSPFIIYYVSISLIPFGYLTAVGYIFACLYGFTKFIDNPYRILEWGVGYAIGSVASNIISTMFIPTISGGSITDIFSGIVILYVAIILYLQAKNLKNNVTYH